MEKRQFLNTVEAAQYIGYSPSWLQKNRGPKGVGPTPTQTQKGKKVRYTPEVLDQWLDNGGQV